MPSSSSGPIIEFYYDISCPFAYIASTRTQALAARTGATIHYRPVLLGAIYRATAAPQGAAGSASDVFNPTKKVISSESFARTLKRYGIAHNPPPRHPQKTTAALRLLYCVRDQAARVKLTEALFRAYWVQERDVSSKATLIEALYSASIPGAMELIRKVEDGSFEDPEQRRELEESTERAVKQGTPGVPGFWVPDAVWTDRKGERRVGRLFWGQDRMWFLEAVVLAMKEGRTGDEIGRVGTPLGSLVPRVAHGKGIPSGKEVKLEFWYDFSSPWAFLGWTQLARLQRRFGERLQIEMKPFLLGILFREIGAPNTPMSAVSEQKRNYSQLDHQDWCRWWNAINEQEGKPDKPIEFYWADIFPIRTPTVLRAALVEPGLVGALFRACWERNLNMSSDEVLKQVIAETQYDANAIMERANSDEIKKALRARTKEAKDVGLCGVPSYRVFQRTSDEKAWKQVGGIVWGQDELAVVEDMVVGRYDDGTAAVGGSGEVERSRL